MATHLEFIVNGLPAPQGSKEVFVRTTKTGKTVRNVVESSARVKPWRAAVAQAARAAIKTQGWGAITGAASVRVVFFFQRPAAHYGTGRKADVMRADAPPWPTGNHGDLDKLVRATLDGLTEGGVWTDDKLVVELLARKRFAGSQPSGRRPDFLA